VKVLLVGRGRVGRGLQAALRSRRERSRRVRTELVSGRRPPERAVRSADVVVLAVPDASIAATAARIAPSLRHGAAVLHCAGARGAEELAACAIAGAHVGVMHPMASFASAAKPPALAGTTFVVVGTRPAVRAARAIATAAGARVVVAAVHGPAYHAAAALAANGAAALASAASHVLERLGVRPRDARRIVAGLLRTVADNVDRVGVPSALTGPIRRGDPDTVRAHRAALRRLDRSALRAYDAIAPVILDCARAASLSPAAASKIRRAMRLG
jgi:predicted short-subunit dehydrogenase-like oxidoreductase (DUF2520 family)